MWTESPDSPPLLHASDSLPRRLFTLRESELVRSWLPCFGQKIFCRVPELNAALMTQESDPGTLSPSFLFFTFPSSSAFSFLSLMSCGGIPTFSDLGSVSFGQVFARVLFYSSQDFLPKCQPSLLCSGHQRMLQCDALSIPLLL